MDTARPAPLLGIALAFSVGCWLGLCGWIASEMWLGLTAAFGLVWLVLIFFARSDKRSLLIAAHIALLFFGLAVGAYRGSLRETYAVADDLRLLPGEKENPRSQWRGVVTGDPRFRPRADKEKDRDEPGRTTLVIDVDGWRSAAVAAAGGPWEKASGQLQVRVDQTTPDQFRYGDVVEVIGGLDAPSRPMNPGQFDIAAYLYQRDIYFSVAVPATAVRVIERRGGNWLTAWAWHARDWALAQLRLGLEDDPTTSALLSGMLLGYVEQVPGEIETAFRNTGTYHVFAVSGQNVAVICGVGLVALQMIGLVRWRWGWVLVPVLVFYCLITGGQPSAVRALLMAVLVLGAWWCERPASTLNLWSIALLAVTGYDPKLVTNLSFQLSFAVVGAIIVLTPPFFNFLSRPLKMEEGSVTDHYRLLYPWRFRALKGARATALLFATSLAAWLGSLPLMAWYFHQVTLIGLIANVVVVPLAGVIVVLGAIALALAPLSAALTVAVNNANWLLVKLLVWAVTSFAQVPGGCFYIPDLSVTWRPDAPEFVCLQTGSTTPLLIRYQGRSWLVNTGTESQFKYVTNPLRKFYGVNACELAVLTELSSPQAGGAALLLSEGIVKKWAMPPPVRPSKTLQPWLATMKESAIAPQVWSRGEVVLAPGLTVTVLFPPEENKARRIEDRALVLRFVYTRPDGGTQSLLYAGRIGTETENSILANAAGTDSALQSDVLVQGYHSEKSNLPLVWLEAVRPKHAVLAPAAAYNSERMDSIELLPENERPQVWRQGDCGAVTVRFGESGPGVAVSSFTGTE